MSGVVPILGVAALLLAMQGKGKKGASAPGELDLEQDGTPPGVPPGVPPSAVSVPMPDGATQAPAWGEASSSSSASSSAPGVPLSAQDGPPTEAEYQSVARQPREYPMSDAVVEVDSPTYREATPEELEASTPAQRAWAAAHPAAASNAPKARAPKPGKTKVAPAPKKAKAPAKPKAAKPKAKAPAKAKPGKTKVAPAPKKAKAPAKPKAKAPAKAPAPGKTKVAPAPKKAPAKPAAKAPAPGKTKVAPAPKPAPKPAAKAPAKPAAPAPKPAAKAPPPKPAPKPAPKKPAPKKAVRGLEELEVNPTNIRPVSFPAPMPALVLSSPPVRSHARLPRSAPAGARGVAGHLAKRGPASYSRQVVSDWQRHAGLPVHGRYDVATRESLQRAGVPDPPRPFYTE